MAIKIKNETLRHLEFLNTFNMKNRLNETREKVEKISDPILKEALLVLLTMFMTLFNDSCQDQWLDVSETCGYLKISSRTLQNYRDKGMLPYSQIRAKIYFKLSDLNQFIESHMYNIKKRREYEKE